jgi:hypothetical protein
MVRPANSLDTLLKQINARFPYRDKASDGGLGDSAHASRVSDHNPDSSGDPRIKYIIFMRRIWSASTRTEVYYNGVNAHEKHLHLSVKSGVMGDNARAWNLSFLGINVSPPTTRTFCKLGDRSGNVLTLQKHMTSAYRGYNPYNPTGYYGPQTKMGIAEFQRRVGITGSDADGSIVGPKTLTALTQRGFRP